MWAHHPPTEEGVFNEQMQRDLQEDPEPKGLDAEDVWESADHSFASPAWKQLWDRCKLKREPTFGTPAKDPAVTEFHLQSSRTLAEEERLAGFHSQVGTYTQIGLPQQESSWTIQESQHGYTQHDEPPTWDGRDPHNQAEPYLLRLSKWLYTTNALRTQRGMIIMQYAAGDLKRVINELDLDILT